MTPIVLDTSVIFKWSRQPDEEPHVPQAVHFLDRLLRGESEIHVPVLLFYELGNTLKQKRHLLPNHGEDILLNIFTLGLNIHDLDPEIAERTYKMSVRYDISFYDATFAMLAQANRFDFITADRKLHQKLRTLPFVRFLGDIEVTA